VALKLVLPEFEGRYTSHEGHRAAAEWVASHLEEWGLEPYGQEEGFLHPYPSPMTLQDEAEMTLLLPDGKANEEGESSYREVPLELESEFMPFFFSANGSGEAGIVFAGWGVSAPEFGYDDFANIDVNGKFVVLFRGSPSTDDPGFQEWMSQHRSSFLTTARERGALGILYVYSKEPIVYTGTEYVEGYTPFLDAVSQNVIGYVEGSDPDLRNEAFFLFAYMDHAGSHFGRVFPGAHDNASGTAVVMELARTFAQLPEKPKRSVVFVLFTAEEVGLGPSFFTDSLPEQFIKIDGVFNYDMVGGRGPRQLRPRYPAGGVQGACSAGRCISRDRS
jgi:hypothetical protein